MISPSQKLEFPGNYYRNYCRNILFDPFQTIYFYPVVFTFPVRAIFLAGALRLRKYAICSRFDSNPLQTLK